MPMGRGTGTQPSDLTSPLTTSPCTTASGLGAGCSRLRADDGLYQPQRRLGASQGKLHYIGRAFDLFVYSGGFDLARDPYLLQLDEETGVWRVLARVVDPEAPLAPRHETIAKVVKISQSGGGMRRRSAREWVPVTARVFDLTALAAEHGFTPIPARQTFMQGGSYSGAEWWHFECRKDLLPTFGEELLRLYSEQEIQIQFAHPGVLGTALR